MGSKETVNLKDAGLVTGTRDCLALIRARIYGSPAGTVGEATAANDVETTLNVVHFSFVQRGDEALDLEIGK